MRVVFFGTPDIAAFVLRHLHAQGINLVAVVSKPDKPKGRSMKLQPTPVRVAAEELKLPLLQPEKASDPEFIETLKELKPDLFAVVAYGEIVKQAVLDIPSIAAINMHASLLPEYRGAAPMQRALFDGKEETGVTIMHMVRKMDAGAMIAQEKIPLPSDMNLAQLEKAMGEVGSLLLADVIKQFETNVPSSTPQDESKATLAPKIEMAECRLDFSKSAKSLHNLIRAVSPEPGAFFFAKIRGEEVMVKVYRSTLIAEEGKPGAVVLPGKGRLLIGCGQDTLEILELQTAGRKRLPAKDWVSGLMGGSFDIISAVP